MDALESEGYRIEELVLKDDWGELFNATYMPHQYRVSIRKFPLELAKSERAWDLACAQIQVWARLNHPGIVQVLDWGLAGATPYLVTDRPEGEILSRQLQVDTGGLDAHDVLSGLLVAIEAARRWGVIHLGLRPSNIWVASDGRVRVAEFGLWYVAREFPELFGREDIFLAPEQRGRGRVSAATDVYAIAVLYVAMRCGVEEARKTIGSGYLPPELEGERIALSRCLDPRPLFRCPSAGELARAMGLEAGEQSSSDYRECPICRLKAEINMDLASRGQSRSPVAGPAKYAWAVIALLAAVAFLIWWSLLK